MKIKVWGILEGPISEERNETGEDQWYLVCKTEVDGKIETDTFWFECLDDAYEWQKHFAKSIDPIIVE